MDERIEAAAKAFFEASWSGEVWGQAKLDRQNVYREDARAYIEAGFPELFTVPPTGWIAPWTMPTDIVIDSDEWVQMRDEYLHLHPMKPTEAKE